MFDLNKDIILQIAMISYNEYNEAIANAVDHLGEFYCLKDVEDMEAAREAYEKECAYKAIKELQEERLKIRRENLILERYLTLIYDIAYDYDGYSDASNLMGLIDEIAKLSKLGKERDVTECIYEGSNQKLNILFEEIKDKNE